MKRKAKPKAKAGKPNRQTKPQTIQAARQSYDFNSRFNRAEAMAAMGTWEMDGKLGDVYWSDEFYRLHGLKPKSVKPSTKLRLSMIHPDDRERLRKAFDHTWQTGKPYSLENRIVLLNGKIKWLLSQGEVNSHLGNKSKTIFGVVTDITQYKEAEFERNRLSESLRKSEQVASVGSWEMYGNFSEIHWSDEFYKIHGLKPQSVKPSVRLRLSMVHPHDRAKLQKAIDEAVKNGKNYSLEKRIILPNGNQRWVLSQGEVSFDENTGKRKVFGTIQDITERKAQEFRNEEIQQNLNRAQEVAGLGSWEVIGNNDEIHWSDEFYKIHGLKPQSVKPSTKLRLAMVHLEDRAKIKKAIEQATRSGKPYSLEKRIIRPDGEIRWVLSQGEVTTDELTGKQKVFGTLLDITERKESHHRLEREETKKDLILNSSLDGFIIIDSSGIIKTWSSSAEKIFGWSRSEVLGRSLTETIIPPQHKKAHQVGMETFLVTGHAKIANKLIEITAVSKNGNEFPVELTVVPFQDGKDQNFFSFIRDITQRKKVFQELELSNSRLSETLLFGKMGSAELELATGNLLVSKELYHLLDVEMETEQALPVSQFLSTYVHPDYLSLIYQKISEGASHSSTSRKEVSVEFEMNTAKGRRIWIEAKGIFKGDKALGILQDITVWKKSQDEIVTKGALINTMLSGITDGFFATDIDLNFTLVSPVFAQLSGLNTSDMLGKNILTLFPYLKGSGLINTYQNALRTQQSSTLELPNTLNPDQIFSVSIYPNTKGLFVYYRDVSLEKRAIQDLIEARDQFFNMIANLPGYVYRVANDPDYTPIYISPQVEKVTGYAQQEYLVDRTISCGKEVHPDDADRVWDVVQDALKQKQSYECEYRIITKQDFEKWVWEKGKGVFDDQGELKYLEGFVTDITDQKVAEVALRNSEHDLRAILNASTDSTIFLDTEGRIRVCNKMSVESFEKHYKVKLEGIEYFEDLLPSPFKEEFLGYFNRALKGEQVTFEREVKSQNAYSWVHTSYLPVYDNFGEIIGVSQNVTDITERKLAERALEESESDLRAMLNAATESTFFLDMKGNIRVANAAAFKDIKEVLNTEFKIGNPFTSHLPPAMHDIVTENFNRALAGEIVQFEREVPQVNGPNVWRAISYLPVRDNEGGIMGVSVNASDITIRKIAELGLLESKERFKLLYNNTPAMMHSIDSSGRLIRVSDFWLHKMGYTREEVLGKLSTDFLTEESQHKARETYMPEFFSTGKITNAECQFVTKDGRVLDTLLSASSKMENGAVTKSMVVVTDISDRKKLVKEVEKLALIASRTSNIVILTDAQQKITWVNEGFERITGYSRDEAIGKNPNFLQGEETSKETTQQMRNAFARGEGFRTEVLNYNKLGKKYWLDMEVMPLFNSSQEVIGYMAIESDITNLKQAIEEMLRSEQVLQTFMDYAPMVAFIKDLEGHYLFYNKNYRDFMKDKNLVVGNTDYEIFDKKFADWCQQQDRHVATSEETIQFEHHVGEDTFLEFKFPLRDSTNHIFGVGGISLNITEKIEAQRIIAESEERFRSLIKDVNIGILLMDREGKILMSNEAALTLLGISEAQIKNRTTFSNEWQVVHEDGTDFPAHTLPPTVSLKTKQPVRSVVMGIDRPSSQDRVWLLVDSMPRVDSKGEIISVISTFNDITKLRQAQKDATVNMERVRTISDNLPSVAIYQYEVLPGKFEGHYLYYGSGVEGITGLKPEDLLRNPNLFEARVHPDDWKIKKQKIIEANVGMTEFNQEYRFQHVKGNWIWLRTRSNPTKLDDGRIIWNGLIIDITEQKLNEQRIKENEERLRSIIMNEPNCIKILNRKGELLEMNPSGLAMIEADNLESVKGGVVADLIDKPFRRRFRELTELVIQGGSGKFEFVITGLKGGKRWLETNAVPLKDPISNENLLLGITRDVTAERQAEQELLLAKNRLELATQAAGLGIWDADLTTGKIIWDKGMSNIYGLDREEFILTKQDWTRFIHPEDLHILEMEDQNAIQSDRQLYKAGFRIIRKDNQQIRHVETLGIIDRDAEGKALRMTGVNMDRTNEKIYENQLIDSVKEKEVLIKEIHHRVKNNLQLISSILYIRTNAMDLTTEMKNFLENTRQKIKLIALIHERLLQTGSINEVDISDYLGKLIKDLLMSNERQDLDITIDASIEPEKMNLDTAIYCGLIINELVTNSIKHAFANRTEGKIDVSLHRKGGMHEMKVCDNGSSIPEVVATRKSGSFGMQMLDVFIKQLGGEMEVNRVNGTCFIINFK